MSDTLTLGIAVDAAPAETGAGKVTAAYRAIEQRADAMANAVSRADAAMNRLGSGSAFDRVTRQIAGGASGVDAMAAAMERAERVEKAMQQAMSSMADASAKQTAAINTMNAALEKLLNTRKNLNDVPKPKPAVDETEAAALDRITQRMQAAKAAREAQAQATTQQKAAQDALNASVAQGAGGLVSNAGLLSTEAAAAEKAAKALERLTIARLAEEIAAKKSAAALQGVLEKYDPVYAAVKAHGSELARVTAILDANNSTEAERARVLKAVADAYDPATKASNARTAALNAEDEAQAKLMAGYKEQAALARSSASGQSMWNAYAGVGQGSSGSAAASAAVFEEQARAAEAAAKAIQEEQAAVSRLVGQYAPLTASQQKLSADKAAFLALQKDGKLTAEQEAAVLAGLEAKQRNLDNMQKTLGGSTKAQAQHFQSLKYQINDVVTGFISGQPPMMIFTQQGGQIIQALDGMDMGLSKVKASTWALAGATVATVAVLATVGARIASISSEAKQLDTITKVLNPNLGATAEQLRNISFAVADQGTSRATGMAALTAIIKDARIQSTELAGQIAKVSVDVAAVMGGEVPDWAKKIADAASAGSQGFDKLLGTLPGITAETMKAVRAAEQHGDRLGAAKIAVDALEKQYGGSAKNMQGAWDEAIHQMGRTFDDFLEKIAKSNPAQGLANFMRDAAKGMGWWVNGVPSDIQNATDRAALGGILDRETASLRQLVEGGASGDVLERQQKKVKALQEQYYGLAAAASAAASAQSNAAGGGNGGNGNSAIGGQIAGLNEDDRNKLNLATASTERQAAASKLLAGSLSVQARAAAENRIALADMAMQYPALGAAAAKNILTTDNFSATLKTLPPELQNVYKQMQDNSANKLAGDVAQAAVALSSASNAAKMNAEASGLGEAAMRRASIEAEVYAHRMDGTAGAVRDALEEQEKFAQEGIWNAFSRGIDQQVAANDRMIAAYGKSDKAVEDATRYNEAYLQTLKEYPESMKDMPAYEDLWTVALNRNIEKLKERDLSKLAKDVAAYSQALRRAQDDLKVEKVAAGLSETSAIDLKARYDALKAMGLTLDKYNELDDATKTIVDNNLNIASAIAQQTNELSRQKDAWNIITSSIEKAFDNIGSSLIDGLVKGQKEALKLSTIVGSIKTQLLTSAAQLGVNTITNAVGLTNKGDLVSLLGGSSSGAANRSGGGILGGNAGNALSLGTKLAPESWTSGLSSSIDMWGAENLGVGAVAPGPTASGAAGYVPAGTGLSSYLASAGVGGAAGGIIGGMIGTATNSKVAGGLSGAASGAAASMALAGSIVPGVGTAIGALAGAIMGMIGTQKATVGKTASADVTINAGGKSATYGNVLTDNEGDPAAGQALGKALSGIYSIAAMGGGSLTKNFGIGQTAKDGLYVGGSVPYQKFGDDIAGLLRYTLLDQGGLQGGGANTIAALKATKATDWEEAAKDIGLGASIDAGNTALKSMIKTLDGVTDAAKKATADSLQPMLDELSRAEKLGIGDAYKNLATDQLKAYLDQLRNPPDFAQMQTDVATLTGQFAAAKEAYAQLNPEMVTYVDQIQAETMARLASNQNRQLDQQIAEASGRGYVNQISGFLDTLSVNARSLAAVGEPATRAQTLFNASLTGVLKTLTTDQLSDVVRTFGGDIGNLATQLATANDNVQQATQFETLFGQIRQTNIQNDIASLNDQISTAKSAQNQWQNLLTSIGNSRGSMLTGDLSPLSAKDKASESLSQFFAAVDKAKGGDVDAAGQVQSLAQTALQANKSYLASSEDYARVFSQVQDGLGGVESVASKQVSLQSTQLSTLQSSLATQQDMLKALQVVPSDIATIIKGINSGNSSDALKWSSTQDTGTQAQVKKAVLQSYTNDQIEAAFGGFSDIQAARAADPSFNLAQWFQSYGMNEVLAGTRKIPGFASGGVVGNGTYGVDSVVAAYAGGGNIALAGGEGVLTAAATSAIGGAGAVDYINRNHALPANDRYGSNILPFRGGNGGQSDTALLNEVKAMRADNARANKDHSDLMKALVTENAQLRRQNTALINEARRTRQQLSDAEGKKQPRTAYK